MLLAAAIHTQLRSDTTVFHAGEANFTCFRIPVLQVVNHELGEVLADCRLLADEHGR